MRGPSREKQRRRTLNVTTLFTEYVALSIEYRDNIEREVGANLRSPLTRFTGNRLSTLFFAYAISYRSAIDFNSFFYQRHRPFGKSISSYRHCYKNKAVMCVKTMKNRGREFARIG